VLDLAAAHRAGLFHGDAASVAELAAHPRLNTFLAAGPEARQALRLALHALLVEGAPARASVEPLLHPARACRLHLPAEIGDYTDFYTGIHHAMNVGKQFRRISRCCRTSTCRSATTHGFVDPRRHRCTARSPRSPNEAGRPSPVASRLRTELGIWTGRATSSARRPDRRGRHIGGFAC
jgi:fumarylacetoacetase